MSAALAHAVEDSDTKTVDQLITYLGLDKNEVLKLAQARAMTLLNASGLRYNAQTLQLLTVASIDGILLGYNAAGIQEWGAV